MINLVEVLPSTDYKIWVKFEDGVEGEVDLSGFIARGGLFKKWQDRTFFESAWIPEGGVVRWGDSEFHELCADSLYMTVTGITFDEYAERVSQRLVHA